MKRRRSKPPKKKTTNELLREAYGVDATPGDVESYDRAGRAMARGVYDVKKKSPDLSWAEAGMVHLFREEQKHPELYARLRKMLQEATK